MALKGTNTLTVYVFDFIRQAQLSVMGCHAIIIPCYYTLDISYPLFSRGQLKVKKIHNALYILGCIIGKMVKHGSLSSL